LAFLPHAFGCALAFTESIGMDAQIGLFDCPPPTAQAASHANDPASSRIAAERHVSNGKARRHRDLILERLKFHERTGGQPITAGEIAAGIDWSEPFNAPKHAIEVRRRLVELHDDGFVVNSGDKCRKCEVCFSSCMTWRLA